MDPVIVSAFIAAVSAIAAAIISGIVAIKVKEMELRAGNKLPQKEKISTFWKWALLGAIIGIILTILFLRPLPWNIPSIPAGTQETNVLFNQNFDNGNADGITYLGDKTIWSVIKDETGNYVLDGDNTKGKDDYPRAIWGDQAWGDYELILRIRFMNQPPQWTSGIIYFRSNTTHRSYQLNLNPFDDDVTLNFDGTSYSTLEHTSFIVDPQKWYLLYIKAEGENILVKIDDDWVFETKDSNRSNGNLNLVPEKGVHFQVDDILVSNLQ